MVKVTIRMPRDTMEAAKIFAIRHRMTLQALMIYGTTYAMSQMMLDDEAKESPARQPKGRAS